MVAPDKSPQGEDGIVIEQSSPGWPNIERLYLRTLVGGPEWILRRIGLAHAENVVEAVRVLEPRTRKTQVYMDRVSTR